MSDKLLFNFGMHFQYSFISSHLKLHGKFSHSNKMASIQNVTDYKHNLSPMILIAK